MTKKKKKKKAKKKSRKRLREVARWGGAAAVVISLVVLLSVLGGLGYLTPAKRSTGLPTPSPPFYTDPAVLRWWFPLQTDYIDQAGHAAISLTNASAALNVPGCLPQFINGSWWNPCAGVGQGLLITPSALSVPYAFSAVVARNCSGCGGMVLGSALNASMGLDENNAIEIAATEIDVIHAGQLAYGGAYAFAASPKHIVVSINDTASSIWIDGALFRVQPTFSFPNPAAGAPLVLGNDLTNDGNDLTFVGFISHARLFSRALNASEVAQLYAVDTKG